MAWSAWGRRLGVTGLAVVGGVLIAGCGRHASTSGASVRVTGDTVDNGKPLASGRTSQLGTGDLVEVRDGSAKVSMPGGGRLELRAGSVLRWTDPPTVMAGDVLAEAGSSAVHLATTVADVTVTGAARIHRDLALTVGTYTGQTVVGAGRTVAVPALAQDTIPSISIVPVPGPLQLDAGDAWDQRFLGAAIDLTNQLDSQSRYMDANVSSSVANTASFYVRGLSVRAIPASLLEATNPTVGDGVAAAAIALAGPGDFTARWRYAFALRAAGAQWGIVVLDEAANPAQVLQLVESAVRDAATAATPAVATTPLVALPLTPVTPVAPTVQAAPLAQPAPARGRSTLTPTTTTPPRTTSTTTPPPTLGSVLAPVLDPLGNLLGGLLGTPKH